jgi:hypothetical protein
MDYETFWRSFETARDPMADILLVRLSGAATHTANMVKGYQDSLPCGSLRYESALTMPDRIASAVKARDSSILYREIGTMDFFLHTHLANDLKNSQADFGSLAKALLTQMADLQLRISGAILKANPPEEEVVPASFYAPMMNAMNHLISLPEGFLRPEKNATANAIYSLLDDHIVFHNLENRRVPKAA